MFKLENPFSKEKKITPLPKESEEKKSNLENPDIFNKKHQDFLEKSNILQKKAMEAGAASIAIGIGVVAGSIALGKLFDINPELLRIYGPLAGAVSAVGYNMYKNLFKEKK